MKREKEILEREGGKGGGEGETRCDRGGRGRNETRVTGRKRRDGEDKIEENERGIMKKGQYAKKMKGERGIEETNEEKAVTQLTRKR